MKKNEFRESQQENDFVKNLGASEENITDAEKIENYLVKNKEIFIVIALGLPIIGAVGGVILALFPYTSALSSLSHPFTLLSYTLSIIFSGFIIKNTYLSKVMSLDKKIPMIILGILAIAMSILGIAALLF